MAANDRRNLRQGPGKAPTVCPAGAFGIPYHFPNRRPGGVLVHAQNRGPAAAPLALCRENGVRTYLLGNGSNTLFADEGYDGAVIDLRGLNFGPTAEPQPDGSTCLTAGAGLTLGRLCAVAQQQSLAGLAFACGIPGTIGGAVYMNAGAYGGEMKDVLESVTFLDSDLTERTLPAAELALGYRTSLFEQHPNWCVLSATVRLQPGDSAAILAEMQDYLQRRKDKQPMEWPSAAALPRRPRRLCRQAD